MTQSSDLPSETGANAEDTLEHALRERPVVDDAFDDGADTAEGAPASADVGTPDDAEDYVLYSEVRPHLEASVDEDELLLLADAQTSGGLLVVGAVPGAPVIGEVVAGGEHTISVR